MVLRDPQSILSSAHLEGRPRAPLQVRRVGDLAITDLMVCEGVPKWFFSPAFPPIAPLLSPWLKRTVASADATAKAT